MNRDELDLSFLSKFIHQIINPLSGVSGTLDNIVNDEIAEDRKPQRLRAAREQLLQAIFLLRNFAYFTDLEGKSGAKQSFRTDHTCVIPETILYAAVYFQEYAEQEKNMDICLDNKHIQYKVKGNKHLLQQVFLNIFENFTKYGEDSSVVNVVPWIQKHSDNLIIEISGKSLEFSNSEANDLFELGYRNQCAIDTLSSGTGIGLYICKVIINNVFNGRIESSYDKQNGKAIFKIRIPGAWYD
jgi:K+-sensing histidine kinase KdpD